ncbi:MAG: VWA domain-containing protein [Pseudomonadota bacterium]
MTQSAAEPWTGTGRLADNIVHFARALRGAGFRVGPAQVQDAVRAVAATGFTRKADFYYTLRATMITRAEQIEVFDQVFALFWRDPEYLERMIELMSPTHRNKDAEDRKRKPAARRRAAEAVTGGQRPPIERPVSEELQIEAHLAWSDKRVDRHKDFEQMSAEETAEAVAAIASLDLQVPPLRHRRLKPSATGQRIDPTSTLRRSVRHGGEIHSLTKRAPIPRLPDLVALCDISGSMSSYTRMMLHFLHTLALSEVRRVGRVHAFTFGTELTNISRALNQRDPDRALEAVGTTARDWEGGTLIGAGLERFNKDWARRVLGRGAAVLLITDGLERGDPSRLAREAERLSLSCRRLIWLNPLLRWDGFSPLARGVQALLPHVDDFLPCHSVASLQGIAEVLSEKGRIRAK